MEKANTERYRGYRGSIGEEINPHKLIPKAEYDKKNKEKSWQYRQYPNYDINFICISKDGTLGEIYKVGNLLVGLPSVEGKEVINSSLSDDEAKWVRKPPPKEFNDLWVKYKYEMAKEKNGTKRGHIKEEFKISRDLLIKKHKKFIASEFQKREYGMFVKIDNEVHYLTGENFMFLQHYYLTESNMHPKFRLVATESYWHWEAVRADTRVWGEIRLKARRTSWSVECASIALNTFTITKYAEIPLVSERKDLASKFFTGKIVNSFKYYPIYFKPLIQLPNDQVKSALEIVFETDESERSVVDFYPTKTTAYDSLKVNDISINDEVGKWENESLTEFIARHYRCHSEGNSKAKFGSTAGHYSGGGGEEFHAEYEKANASERNELGRTENGLVSLFIDVCYTMTQPVSYFDEWGYSVVNDPIEPILNEAGIWIEHGAITDWTITFDTLKKSDKKTSLNAFLRDMPRNQEHAFRNEGSAKNDFDITNLNNHLDYLNNFAKEDMTGIIFRGNLVWSGEPYKSDVEWRPNPRGKFHTTWIPPKDLQNKSSKKMFMNKEVNFPSNNHIGCFGVDSYDIIGNTATNDGSDGAIMGYSKFSMEGCPSHSFFLKYKERPDKRDDFYDDVIKVCQFFGFYALIESNKSRVLEYMYDKGYTGYAMRRQDKRWKDLSDAEKIWGGMPSSKMVIADQASLLKDYIVDFVGNNLETDCKVYFKDLILEWINFNLDKRKEFDLGVASGFSLMGAQHRVKMRASKPEFLQGGLNWSNFGA